MMLDRRRMMVGAAALAGAACVPLDQGADRRLVTRLGLIERELGGRLGVAFHDPFRRGGLAYRGEERFPMASTFKASLAALALAMEQDGRLDLSRQVTWTKADLIFHTPFTGEHVGTGATLRELARAAVMTSDNLAANIVLDHVGGPEGLTAFWRRIGDDTSRLDRKETALNFVPEGELRDTTTPAAMARTLATILSKQGNRPLAPERVDQLAQWMTDARTGLARVRAGLPSEWISGDKTGNSSDWDGKMGYLRGDIGFTRGPADTPSIFFAAYHQSPLGATIDGERVDAAFAEIGEVLTDWTRQYYAIVVT